MPTLRLSNVARVQMLLWRGARLVWRSLQQSDDPAYTRHWRLNAVSCDWNIYCRTCDETHAFNDANRLEAEMHVLIKYAAQIAALAPVQNECGVDVQFGFYSYGSIEPSWFARHLGHDLVPRDEYGRCADQCAEDVVCEHCGHRSRCARKLNHLGSHAQDESS